MIDIERAERLRVLWNKGRNFYQSFFAELGTVHAEIGNDAEFTKWCMYDLGISVGIIASVTDVLRKVDAAIERNKLARAREIELAKKREKIQAEQQRRAEEKAAREAEKARKEAEKKEKEKREKNKEKCRRQRQRKREQEVAQYSANALAATIRGEIEKPDGNRFTQMSKPALLPDADRAAAIKSALSRVLSSRDEWVEGSVELGALLHQERSYHQADREFGAWLVSHDINISHQDRAALINLASDLEAMRKTLASTDRSSYQHIWGDVRKRIAA